MLTSEVLAFPSCSLLSLTRASACCCFCTFCGCCLGTSLSSLDCELLEDSVCISTYALSTFSWLLLREVAVAVGDTLRRDPKVSGWQADRAARAGWSAVFWGWDSQEDVRSSLAVCLGGCGPALLRSKHRNLRRGRRGGKAQAVTDDFERRSVSFYPMTGGAGVERAMLGSQRK